MRATETSSSADCWSATCLRISRRPLAHLSGRNQKSGSGFRSSNPFDHHARGVRGCEVWSGPLIVGWSAGWSCRRVGDGRRTASITPPRSAPAACRAGPARPLARRSPRARGPLRELFGNRQVHRRGPSSAPGTVSDGSYGAIGESPLDLARSGSASIAAASPTAPPTRVSQARAASTTGACRPPTARVTTRVKAKAPQAMS